MVDEKHDYNTLRTEAEAKLVHTQVTDSVNLTSKELLHELQVHQVELEMQNEELRNAYRALEESRDRYKDLYDFSPLGYLLIASDGRIIEMNLTASIMLGESRSKLFNSNRHFPAFVIPADADQWSLFFSSIMKCDTRDNRRSVELTLRRCDNSEFPAQLDCICLDSMLRIAITDLTEIKKAEKNLLEVEKHTLAIALASADMGSWDWDIKTGYVIFNERWASIRGYRLDEVSPHENSLKNGIHTDDLAVHQAALEAHLENKTPIFQAEYRVRNRFGSVVWVMNRGTVIQRDPEGHPLRMAGIEMDITEGKLREQKDMEHLDELAHVTRLGLMGQMASGIAHEVNQPLTAIATYSQVSLNLVKTRYPDRKQLTELLSKTQEQALRAGRIIHNMREFIKSNIKQRSIADVNALVQDAAGLCVNELKQNNIKLKFELESNLPPVYVEHAQIEQVFINLIRNSVDVLKKLPQETPRQLAIQTQLSKNHDIEIKIKDNGSGIDKDQQQKILTPFYTTKGNAMGMGLSISRSLIEAHEGTLHFNSKHGKGTTFYINLPISDKH
ncbi:MAG: PAS domain-containing sensor histidine kinase [Methylobacter sp.]